MDSIWLKIDEDSQQNSKLGVFTMDPAFIAKRIPRPVTPFVPQSKKIHKLFSNGQHNNKSELFTSKGIALESPVANDEIFKIKSQPLISVF